MSEKTKKKLAKDVTEAVYNAKDKRGCSHCNYVFELGEGTLLFEAGYAAATEICKRKRGYPDKFDVAYADGFGEGRAAAIKEVLEWCEKHAYGHQDAVFKKWHDLVKLDELKQQFGGGVMKCERCNTNFVYIPENEKPIRTVCNWCELKKVKTELEKYKLALAGDPNNDLENRGFRERLRSQLIIDGIKNLQDAERQGAKWMLDAIDSVPFDASDSFQNYRKLVWEAWEKKQRGKNEK